MEQRRLDVHALLQRLIDRDRFLRSSANQQYFLTSQLLQQCCEPNDARVICVDLGLRIAFLRYELRAQNLDVRLGSIENVLLKNTLGKSLDDMARVAKHNTAGPMAIKHLVEQFRSGGIVVVANIAQQLFDVCFVLGENGFDAGAVIIGQLGTRDQPAGGSCDIAKLCSLLLEL